MREVNYLIAAMVLVSTSGFVFVSFRRKAWASCLFGSAFLFRILLCVLFEKGGLKNTFVIDSLMYEQRGWLLAQNWVSDDNFMAFVGGTMDSFTNYEIFLSYIFVVFGHEPLMGTFVNSLLSVLTIFLTYRMQVEYFTDREEYGTLGFSPPALIGALLLGAYPSYLVWSVTNIRDPLYFFSTVAFFYCFFRCFSKKSAGYPLAKLGYFGLCVLSFWNVLGLRSYVSNLFLASIAIGYCVAMALRFFKLRSILVFLAIAPLVIAYTYQFLMPESTNKLLVTLKEMRLGFANLRLLDSVAKSSFGLDHPFDSVTDVLTFLPNSLSHYFFGPFPWEVSSMAQGLSLLETAIIVPLVYPTIRGIKMTYRRSRTEVIVLLSFIVAFVFAQSLVISNMGTIFRHRSLPFILLSIFTGEGLYEIYKKGIQAFFEIEYRRPRDSRRQPLGGSKPVRV